jgi:hypothetical protein
VDPLRELVAVTARPRRTVVDQAEAANRVPTIDDPDDAPPPADYRDWRAEDTRVVTYTNDPDIFTRDRPAWTMEEARTKCQAEFGRILEVNSVPGRWFFRVFRVRREA